MQPSRQQGQKIVIYVTSPLLDTAKGHFTYLVSGCDQNGQIQIRRRYNDFYYLRQSLRKRFPGLYIPPVPEKMLTGNKDEGNIQMRRRYFEYFLQQISESSHLFYASVTQEFLRNKGVDMEKLYTSLSHPKPEQSLNQYQNIYRSDYQSIDSIPSFSAQHKKVVGDFTNYLKKADKQLKSLKTAIQQIIDSRNAFINNLISDVVTTTVLPQYEKNVYSTYIPESKEKDGLLFVSQPRVQENCHKLKQVAQVNSFQSCLDMIAYESLEVEAMQELLNDRDGFETHYHKCREKLLSSESELAKLKGGKTTIKSFFSKGNKDEQIKKFEDQVPIMRQQQQQWSKLVKVMSVVIAQKQIPKFKKHKQLKYYDVMHTTSQKELNYLVVYGDLMKSLMQGIVKAK